MTEALPRHAVSARALALAYRSDDAEAPRAVLKGHDLVAEEVIRRARAAGVFAHDSPELVALLAQVDLDARIPAPAYRALAQILAWIYEVGGSRPASGIEP